ncbi:MAG: hypothetical protein ACYDBQ_01665 [Thermoplasmatota archaeon]
MSLAPRLGIGLLVVLILGVLVAAWVAVVLIAAAVRLVLVLAPVIIIALLVWLVVETRKKNKEAT